MNWILLFVGFLAGTAASMGIGGGFVLMLYLTLLTETSPEEARLFNLLFFLPVAALSVYRHRKNGLIPAKPVFFTLLGGIPGVLLGVWLGRFLTGPWLTKAFALLIGAVGLKEFFSKKEKQKTGIR